MLSEFPSRGVKVIAFRVWRVLMFCGRRSSPVWVFRLTAMDRLPKLSIWQHVSFFRPEVLCSEARSCSKGRELQNGSKPLSLPFRVPLTLQVAVSFQGEVITEEVLFYTPTQIYMPGVESEPNVREHAASDETVHSQERSAIIKTRVDQLYSDMTVRELQKSLKEAMLTD